MQLFSGSYTGNGTSQSISGVGFQPDWVMVKGAGAVPQMTTASMGADATKPMDGLTALFTGAITSIDADGFSVGSSTTVNANTVTFYYMVARDNSALDFKQGTYAGNGSDNRSISGLGFQPDFVLTAGEGTQRVCYRTSDMAGDLSGSLNGDSLSTNSIQAIESDGFQVGTDAKVNTNTVDYYYVAFKNTASLFKVLSYAGDGTDNRSITGVGFQPENTMIKASNGNQGALRMQDMAGDSSALFTTTTHAADRIQAFEADGFQVGTSGTVNSATGPPTYYSASWKDGSSSPPAAGDAPPPFNVRRGYRNVVRWTR